MEYMFDNCYFLKSKDKYIFISYLEDSNVYPLGYHSGSEGYEDLF